MRAQRRTDRDLLGVLNSASATVAPIRSSRASIRSTAAVNSHTAR